MPNEVRWIRSRIAEARKGHASVIEAVASRMEKLLSGGLSEQPLSLTKLTSIAKALIADMVPTPPKTEPKQ
ncbi:MAG: hypothetical protein NTX17_04935 [Candidatus Eisenbacteria bacterium]|nr:hypothetical protein [Candidatus Eisenbacteria bacterium]